MSDGTAVTWSDAFPGSTPILIRNLSTTSTAAGSHYITYFVLGQGMSTITATSGSVSATRLLSVGEPSSTQPPDPSSVSLVGGPDTTRTAGRFTVTARITDANGALVPDDTPVDWEMVAAYGRNAVFTPISVDRVTANGTASATYAVSFTSAEYVLATARSGSVRSTLHISVPLTWPAESLAGVTLTSSAPSWKLLEIGETITFTATATDINGAAVSNGTSVMWAASGTVPVLSQVSADAATTSGSASATYRAVGVGTGWVTVEVTGVGSTVAVLRNVGAYPEPPDDLALSLHLPADSDNIVPTNSTLRVGASLTYTGQKQQHLDVSGGTLRVAGSQEWESGRRRLTIAGQTTRTQTRGSTPADFLD